MINVAYRKIWCSEETDVRQFPPGTTVAEIVASFDTPLEFEKNGAVYLVPSVSDPDVDFFGGHMVDRRHWHRVKPKASAAIAITCMPMGGDGGGKQVLQIVGAIALIAATMWLASPSGLAFFAPMFATAEAAQIAAYVAAAAVGVGGSLALQMLSRPSAGVPDFGGPSGAGAGLGSAGISQNTIAGYRQVPGVLGIIRVSPPLLARPFTTIENGDQVLHMIVGTCGPCEITNIKINDTAIEDLPTGVLEYETRTGQDALGQNEPLTLITQSGFEENINRPMSMHRLENDQITLVEPASGSYP